MFCFMCVLKPLCVRDIQKHKKILDLIEKRTLIKWDELNRFHKKIADLSTHLVS